ncbi:MAG TPA: hypothetical protein VEB68_00100 [Croceibacterium sp.]|nr:hypothetical protein [Croceibacterium sp.]
MTATTGARFDVAAFIDQRPIGWREITTLAVVSIVLFIDGFDMYFFGKMLPAIAEGLGVTPAGMTGVVTASKSGCSPAPSSCRRWPTGSAASRCLRCACWRSAR